MNDGHKMQPPISDPHSHPYWGPCGLCRHYHGKRDIKDEVNLYQCDAFPGTFADDGVIPEEIWNGRAIHDRPYPGDHGIQFEPLDAEAAQEWKEMIAYREENWPEGILP